MSRRIFGSVAGKKKPSTSRSQEADGALGRSQTLEGEAGPSSPPRFAKVATRTFGSAKLLAARAAETMSPDKLRETLTRENVRQGAVTSAKAARRVVFEDSPAAVKAVTAAAAQKAKAAKVATEAIGTKVTVENVRRNRAAVVAARAQLAARPPDAAASAAIARAASAARSRQFRLARHESGRAWKAGKESARFHLKEGLLSVETQILGAFSRSLSGEDTREIINGAAIIPDDVSCASRPLVRLHPPS